jgi:hypothetical protein
MPAPTIPLASDPRERFLLAIAEQVAPERLTELHFFPPLRQGTIETGVAVVAAEPEAGAPDAPSTEKHVVFSARYRWTRKGPERGRWESEIVAEADAPLITVENVVRGVKERANEAAEPERMTGDAARALIEELRCRTAP